MGTRELNKALQAVLNPNLEELPEKVSGGVIYRIGDRIMQIKNNYDITWEKENGEIGTGVFNGEIGTILEIDEKEKILKIQFDDEKKAWYEYSDLEQIEHSYAITIHKAQRKRIRCSNNVSTTVSSNVINKKFTIYRNNTSKKTINNNWKRQSYQLHDPKHRQQEKKYRFRV